MAQFITIYLTFPSHGTPKEEVNFNKDLHSQMFLAVNLNMEPTRAIPCLKELLGVLSSKTQIGNLGKCSSNSVDRAVRKDARCVAGPYSTTVGF